jgi:hypothetical protein
MDKGIATNVEGHCNPTCSEDLVAKKLMFAYLSKRYFELMENQLHFHKVVFALFQEKSNLQFASSNCKCNTWPFLVRPNHYESNVNTST